MIKQDIERIEEDFEVLYGRKPRWSEKVAFVLLKIEAAINEPGEEKGNE